MAFVVDYTVTAHTDGGNRICQAFELRSVAEHFAGDLRAHGCSNVRVVEAFYDEGGLVRAVEVAAERQRDAA